MNKNKEVTIDERDIALVEIVVPENLQRQSVDDARVMDLARSIEQVGLINRVVVRKTKAGYELVAGYRRFLAFAKLARETIPARVVSARSSVVEQITLDENLEREAINSVDEALWLFQSHIGSIKRNLQQTTWNRSLSFQSHIGSIKSLRKRSDGKCSALCFNPTLVRLKVRPAYWYFCAISMVCIG